MRQLVHNRIAHVKELSIAFKMRRHAYARIDLALAVAVVIKYSKVLVPVVGRAELFNVDHADIDAYGEEVCLAQKIAKISQFAPVFGVETVVKFQPEAARRAVGIFS